jgi:hypothetical protein
MQPTGSLKPRRHLRFGECGIGNELIVGLGRFKAGESAEDLVHYKPTFIGSG